MNNHWKIVLSLLLVLATLSGCAGQQQNPPQQFAEVTQYLGPAAVETPAVDQMNSVGQDNSIFSDNPYDLSAEGDALTGLGEEGYEDDGIYEDPAMDQGADPMINAEAPGTPYPYAGSSPIPLDPVDMPSPTPRSELVFAYVPYTSVGLTFEGPAGWVPDESTPEQFTLTEPDTQVKDKQPGILRVYAIPVNNAYSESNLKTEVLDRLKNIGSTNFDVWDPSLTASRYLMGGKGVYANYSGTMANGIQVGGRIHCTCIDKVLYCIEIVYPLAFKDDYLNVFSKMRETIKRQ